MSLQLDLPILFDLDTPDDLRDVLQEVKNMLDEFWKSDDPLVRFDKILAAQRRIDSVL